MDCGNSKVNIPSEINPFWSLGNPTELKLQFTSFGFQDFSNPGHLKFYFGKNIFHRVYFSEFENFKIPPPSLPPGFCRHRLPLSLLSVYDMFNGLGAESCDYTVW